MGGNSLNINSIFHMTLSGFLFQLLSFSFLSNQRKEERAEQKRESSLHKNERLDSQGNVFKLGLLTGSFAEVTECKLTLER